MTFKGKKGRSISSRQKFGYHDNKKNTKFYLILVSPSPVRGMVQTSRTKQSQRQIKSFFDLTSKAVSQSHIPLNKDKIKTGDNRKY